MKEHIGPVLKATDNTDIPTPAVGFLLSDHKFLANQDIFKRALDCGVIVRNLFNPVGRSQLSLEKIIINDEVHAIDYPEGCNNISDFRQYSSYRFAFVPYAGDARANNCGVKGTAPPANPKEPYVTDPTNPGPCIGDIDIRYSTMLVTTQTSTYSKSWVEMLTEEGGIVGGIMFVTWFLGILNQ